MDTKTLLSVVEQFEENIEDLEECFEPLLDGEGDFGTITKKLPLLDRAKLNVLVVYAIESLLFCRSFRHMRGRLDTDHDHCSLHQVTRRRCQRARSLPRIGTSQTVFRENQERRTWRDYHSTLHYFEQGSRRTSHQARIGKIT